MILFWDVDTQYDFMTADGKLYVNGAESIMEKLRYLTTLARQHNIPIYGSIDYHQKDDSELSENPDFMKTFPPHCMANSPGAKKIKETAPLNPIWVDSNKLSKEEIEGIISQSGREVIFRKQQFDVFSNTNAENLLNHIDPKKIFIYGVALDVCVAHAVNGMLKTKMKSQLYIVEDAVQAIYKKTGNQYLSDWEAKGVKLINSAKVKALISK